MFQRLRHEMKRSQEEGVNRSLGKQEPDQAGPCTSHQGFGVLSQEVSKTSGIELTSPGWSTPGTMQDSKNVPSIPCGSAFWSGWVLEAFRVSSVCMTYHSPLVAFRGQLEKVGSLLPPGRFVLRLLGWQQVLSLIEPSQRPSHRC